MRKRNHNDLIRHRQVMWMSRTTINLTVLVCSSLWYFSLSIALIQNTESLEFAQVKYGLMASSVTVWYSSFIYKPWYQFEPTRIKIEKWLKRARVCVCVSPLNRRQYFFKPGPVTYPLHFRLCKVLIICIGTRFC